ncbi:MAG: glycosyltransferase family 4 protein, partial [Bacteroidota bacterium]
GVDTTYFAPDGHPPDEKSLVFTGVMAYGPNRDAARFLCTEILPRVRDVIPGVVVNLVGSDPPDDVCTLAGNGVRVTGTVSDVRPFVHRATVYVSPLRFGTGMKNKVLSALAMGKAVVASPESCAGLDITPGEHLLVADTPEKFATYIASLLSDAHWRHHLGIAGRKLAVDRYGWHVMARRLEALLESLVGEVRNGNEDNS